MSNVLIVPVSGVIGFDSTNAGNSLLSPLSSGPRLSYDNAGGINISSYTTAASALNRLTVTGSQGQLFSVTDNLTGSLMSVNDIAGLPILEVFDSPAVVIGAFNTNALVVSGSKVGIGTNNPTNPLTVSGNLNATGTIYDGSGNSSQWNNTYTTVSANSAKWTSAYTLLNTTTATTFRVNNLSANGNICAPYFYGGSFYGDGSNLTNLPATSGPYTCNVVCHNICTTSDNNIAAGGPGKCYSAILGGCNNSSSAGYSTILGGTFNNVTSGYSTILGGSHNTILSGGYNTIISGLSNKVSGPYSSIVSGLSNVVLGPYSSVVNGICNAIYTSNNTNSTYNTIINGCKNNISIVGDSTAFISYAKIAGSNNTILLKNNTVNPVLPVRINDANIDGINNCVKQCGDSSYIDTVSIRGCSNFITLSACCASLYNSHIIGSAYSGTTNSAYYSTIAHSSIIGSTTSCIHLLTPRSNISVSNIIGSDSSNICLGLTNSGQYGSIAGTSVLGGISNTVATDGGGTVNYTAIIAGQGNNITNSGYNSVVNASTVTGYGNNITISGQYANVSQVYATGAYNLLKTCCDRTNIFYATINGCNNCINAINCCAAICYSTITNGNNNTITNSGYYNYNGNNYTFINNGCNNLICTQTFGCLDSVGIASGCLNNITASGYCQVSYLAHCGLIKNATIANGNNNSLFSCGCCVNATLSGAFVTGTNNAICNTASCYYASNIYDVTLLGGQSNCISSLGGGSGTGVSQVCYSSIFGGTNNCIITTAGAQVCYSAILGGCNNTLNRPGNFLSNVFVIGSNITPTTSNYTYVNNLSVAGQAYANGVLLGSGGGSNVSGLTGNWQNTYTTVSANSANWNTAYRSVTSQPYTLVALTSSIQTILGSNSALGQFSLVAGGYQNKASGLYSNVNGGTVNVAGSGWAVVGGGNHNQALSGYSVVAGGWSNCANNWATTINGGYGNVAQGSGSTIGGGLNNTASGVYSIIGGGRSLSATGNYSHIGGGYNNTASGNYSTILGGQNNNTNTLSNTFILGSNITATQANYTYVNNISSQGLVYDGTGNSSQWNSAYTLLNTTTATTFNVNVLSAKSAFLGTTAVVAALNSAPLTITSAASGSVFNAIQNTFAGVSASTDVSLYNDDSINYLDLGIASTKYNGNIYAPTFNVVRGGDSYAYATSGNFVIGAANTNGNLTFFTGGTLSGAAGNERMRITNTGFVGVSTLSPNQALTVVGNISATGNTIHAGSWNNSVYTGVSGDGVIIDYLQGSPGLGRISVGNGTGADSLAFYNNGPGQSTPTATMYLSTNGFVGIGTTTPNTNLTVNGSISAAQVYANLNGGNATTVGFGTTAVNGFNFKGAFGTSTGVLFTVPAGKIFFPDSIAYIIDSKTGGTGIGDTMTVMRVYWADGTTQVSNQYAPPVLTGQVNTGDYFRGSLVISTASKSYVPGGTSVIAKIDAAYVNGGTPTTTLLGRVFITGTLI